MGVHEVEVGVHLVFDVCSDHDVQLIFMIYERLSLFPYPGKGQIDKRFHVRHLHNIKAKHKGHKAMAFSPKAPSRSMYHSQPTEMDIR